MPRSTADIEAAARGRELRDKDVIALLDEISPLGVQHYLGAPHIDRRYAEPQGHWKVGDGHPDLADEDPAVLQAIGRCAASRVRGRMDFHLGNIHPDPCGWCGYPLPSLLEVCDWATYRGRFVTGEWLVWDGAEGSKYRRAGDSGYYENRVHRDFWALPQEERKRRIEVVIADSKRVVAG